MIGILLTPIPVCGLTAYMNYRIEPSSLLGASIAKINPVIDTNINQSFCPAAWNSVYVEPGGEIRNCCVAQETIGRVDDDVHQVLTGRRNIEIRQAMLEGQKLDSCRQCWSDSQSVMRHGFVQDYYTPENQDLFASADNFKPQYLDLRWHNTCNFACVYCGPGVSSSWATELGEPNRMDRSSIQRLEDYVLDNLHDVNHVYLAGGEPLLMKENAVLLERLYTINPMARIFVNSNISHASADNAVYQWLTRFPRTYWIISAEALDEKFDYIRYGGTWSEFQRNLYRVRKDFKHHQIGFNAVLCTLNAINIWRFIDWTLEIGFAPEQTSINMHHQGTSTWHGLDCRNLSQDLTQALKESSCNSRYNNVNGITGVRRVLDHPVDINPDLFQSFVQEIDQRRGLDSRRVFPEIYAYIN